MKMQSENIAEMTRDIVYRVAYKDEDFLLSDDCRGVRLQLEFMKADLIMKRFNIESTLVVFGSARTVSPEEAQVKLKETEEALEKSPDSPTCKEAVRIAKKRVEQARYYQIARELGHLVTVESFKRDKDMNTFVVMTGGGCGFMEAANRGACEAGGFSAGVRIELPFEEKTNQYVTPELSFQTHYFCIRKMHFLNRAKALVCFPGGMGTLDELFEVLTMVQTRRVARIPILLYGKEFWERLIHWDVLVDEGYIKPEDLNLFHYCKTAEDGWKFIEEFYRSEKLPEGFGRSKRK